MIFSLFRTQSSQYAIPAFVSRKSAARFLCRMLLPNGVGICGSYHDETTIILGPARPPGIPKAGRGTRTRADRLERLQCQVAARNHSTKLGFGLSIAETLRLGRELAHERNHAGSAAQGGKIATDISP